MSFGEHHIAFGGNGTQQMSTHTPHTNLQAGIWLLIKCTWLSNNQQVWATQKKKFGCLLIWIIQVCLNSTAIFPNVPTNSSQITMIRETAKKRRKLPTGKQVLSLIKCTWLSTSVSSSMKADVWAVYWYATFRESGLVLQTWAPWSHWVNHELVCKSILDSNVRSSAWQLKHGWYWVVPWPYLRTNNSQSAKVQ